MSNHTNCTVCGHIVDVDPMGNWECPCGEADTVRIEDETDDDYEQADRDIELAQYITGVVVYQGTK